MKSPVASARVGALQLFGRFLTLSALLVPLAHAGTPPVFPGATFEKKWTEVAKQTFVAAGMKTEVAAYSTSASYEKVRAFYAGKGKLSDVSQPFRLPNGKQVQQSRVIFDGAADLEKSKSWGTVQFPFIGNIKMSKSGPVFEDLRQVTSIVLTWPR